MKTHIKKEEFLAKIIHDLKTPTLAQISALEVFLANSSDKLNENEKELIELTLNSCNYMQNLIETFNIVYKMDFEQIHLNYEKFNIVNLIKEVQNEIKILLKYNKLNIELKSSKEIIVNADKLQIKRVLENILSNAINNSYKNSTIYINVAKTKSSIQLEVKNNSPYIESKILEEIFEKFKSYPSLHKKAGIGLGLYLSKEIINAHYGKMIAKSFEDNINIFGFELPLN